MGGNSLMLLGVGRLGGGVVEDAILLEDGDDLYLEDDTPILLET